MWYRVWGVASCLVSLLMACGRSERDGVDESDTMAGKSTGASTTGGTGVISGGGAGASVSRGGMAVVEGGSNTMGGASVALAGQPSEPGEGGAPAAGGAAACGYYHACGCGCCGVPSSIATCLYPDLGEDLTEIIEQDVARRMDAASCANVGCSTGQDYFCCAAPPASDDGASYETSVYIGGYNRIHLHKRAEDCSTFTLRQRSAADPVDPDAFPVEVPAGWEIEAVTTLPCASSMTQPKAIGAIGKFSLRVVDDACVVDAHLAAFFSNEQRALSTLRFDTDGVPVDVPIGECK
jgi:hypothetical protein